MEKTLQEQFLHPSDDFTPIPFWFWNDALTGEELIRQIESFAEKGVMGFVIHPRIGIPDSIPYLSGEYMALVETVVKEADRRGMTVILYDEAMYPSGSAKGLVVKDDPGYASRGLKMAEHGCGEPINLSAVLGDGDVLVSAQAVKKLAERHLDPKATVLLEPKEATILFQPPDGGEWSILLFIETYSKGTIRGIHFGEDDGEPNAPPSADLLNPLATRKFIRLTHERYYERLRAYFGNTIQAMFTDEPDILGRRHIKGLRSWTKDFLDCFIQEGNTEIDLPLLWFEAGEADSVRNKYRKAVHKRLVSAYYKPLSDWCVEHGIALTGHPAASDEIGLLEHFQIPGQDVVWRWVAPEDDKALEGRHSTTAKCSSDAARHRGRRRNLNEFLGVCGQGGGWALSAGDMKWYMDWLLVRGVNLLCPHAFYYSIDGPRRVNERPPDVGPNNIWWPHYRRFAQYMKRMSWLMTDSVNVTPIAVLCREDWLPWQAVKPLYCDQREFNYLEEKLLISASTVENGQIRIAGQTYSVVLMENDEQWDEETKQALFRFMEEGGNVICLQTNGRRGGLLSTTEIFSTDKIIPVLDRLIRKDVTLHPPCPDIRVSHVVKEANHFYVLVNEGEQTYEGAITVNVAGQTEQWDPWEGRIKESSPAEEGIGMAVALERRQCLVYRIDPAVRPEAGGKKKVANARNTRFLTDPWRVEPPHLLGHSLSLGSWTEREGLEHYSGTVTYSITFTVDWADQQRVVLDLGEVHEIAEVWVNGQTAGVKMWHPYRFDIHSFVKQGDNELRIAVTNSLANRIDQLKLPSGLLGPVEISNYEM